MSERGAWERKSDGSIGNAQMKEGSATKQVQIHKHVKCK